MTTITEQFGTLYHPVKALLIYQSDENRNTYVEAYDMDSQGCPINAHPLSIRESTGLAKALDTSQELKQNYLKPKGIIPKNLLQVDFGSEGHALWYTPGRREHLYFKASLDTTCGYANIPPLVWKANKKQLYLYALTATEDIDEATCLYEAPFFNIYEDGRVCMGTVDIDIKPDFHLEEFMKTWERYFFQSYFSHLIRSVSPVAGNIIQLWQGLVNTRRKFPIRKMKKHSLTIQDLLS